MACRSRKTKVEIKRIKRELRRRTARQHAEQIVEVHDLCRSIGMPSLPTMFDGWSVEAVEAYLRNDLPLYSSVYHRVNVPVPAVYGVSPLRASYTPWSIMAASLAGLKAAKERK